MTLELIISADGEMFTVQGEEFSAKDTNVFVVKHANDQKLQQVVKAGHFDLRLDPAEPLSVVVLRDNPQLKSLLEQKP